MAESEGVVVLVSGGQDSTTCLYLAKAHYPKVMAVIFDYGQRHRSEIEAAVSVCEMAGVPYELVTIEGLMGGALTDPNQEIELDGGFGGLPSTFVPGRNIVFLSLALSVACRNLNSDGTIPHLMTGVCETDYSGYPDCRRETIDALEYTLNLAINARHPSRSEDRVEMGNRLVAAPAVQQKVVIQTPMMNLSKREEVLLAAGLSGCMEAIAKTVTCYQGLRPGCGQCPSCVLRARGFKEAGIPDPAQ